jgi:hypothetical protein
MTVSKDDWRLQGQEKYLMEAVFQFKQYKDRVSDSDHDHCEFCSKKFTNTQMGTLHEGFTTEHDNRWVCQECYSDFEVRFGFKQVL